MDVEHDKMMDMVNWQYGVCGHDDDDVVDDDDGFPKNGVISIIDHPAMNYADDCESKALKQNFTTFLSAISDFKIATHPPPPIAEHRIETVLFGGKSSK